MAVQSLALCIYVYDIYIIYIYACITLLPCLALGKYSFKGLRGTDLVFRQQQSKTANCWNELRYLRSS